MNDYDLELDRVIKTIKKEKAKLVCLQLPEGLKPLSLEIADTIEAKTKASCIIWLGSCFGACDIPRGIEKLGVDLLVQFGHTKFKAKGIKIIKASD